MGQFGEILAFVIMMVAVGAFSGFSIGLLGVGGGLMLPAALFFALEVYSAEHGDAATVAAAISAAATSCVILGALSLRAALARKAPTSGALTFTLLGPAALGAFLAAGLFAAAETRLQLALLGAALAVAAVRRAMSVAPPRGARPAPVAPWATTSIAGLAGALCGAVGAGAGAVFAPLAPWIGLSDGPSPSVLARLGVATGAAGALGYIVVALTDAALAGTAGTEVAPTAAPFEFWRVNWSAALIATPVAALAAPVGALAARKLDRRALLLGYAAVEVALGLALVQQAGFA